MFETHSPERSGRYLVPAGTVNYWVEGSDQLSILLGLGSRLSPLARTMAGDGSHPGSLQASPCSASSQGGGRFFRAKQWDVGSGKSGAWDGEDHGLRLHYPVTQLYRWSWALLPRLPHAAHILVHPGALFLG